MTSEECRAIFPRRLVQMRGDRSLSPEGLAHIMNRKASEVAAWEQGRSYPGFNQLIDLSEALNAPIDFIVGRIDSHERR